MNLNSKICFSVPVLTSLNVAALCVFKESFSAGCVRSLSDRSSPIAEAIEFIGWSPLKSLSPPSTTVRIKIDFNYKVNSEVRPPWNRSNNENKFKKRQHLVGQYNTRKIFKLIELRFDSWKNIYYSKALRL